MSEVKHTPGPWTWGEDHPQNACATVYGVAEWGQYEIAQLYGAPTDVAKQDAHGVWGDHPERRANARLIAAAPELLEALRKIGTLAPAEKPPEPYDERGWQVADTGERHAQMVLAYEMWLVADFARTAAAKAEGRE